MKGKKIVIKEGDDEEPRPEIDSPSKVPVKDHLEAELKTKEQLLEAERQEKDQLTRLIQEMEKKLMVGGQAVEDKEREQLQKQREI